MEASEVIRLFVWVFGITVPVFVLINKFSGGKSAGDDAEKNHWYLYGIYFNPQDKRIFLYKRSGLGITLNFARITSWLVQGGVVFVIILLIISKK